VALGLLATALLAGAPGSATAQSPEAAPAPVDLTVLTGGDLLVHQPVWDAAKRAGGGRRYAFDALLRPIAPIVRGADVAVCHAETPLVPGAPRGYPSFRTPPGLARSARRTGYDVCSTASNHSVDAGLRGVLSTLKAFRAADVLPTGTSSSARDRGRTPTVRTSSGVRVAVLSYTEMTNGIPLPHPWSVNLARPRRILADARRARRRGAQVVVVNVHWGNEYQSAPSRFQRRLARRLTRTGAVTAVVGQHAHVAQPISRVNGRLVVFGEGNFLSNQTAACCPRATQDGLLAMLRITVDASGAEVSGVDYVPTWVRHPDYAVLPVGVGLRRNLAPARVLRASRQRTIAVAGRARGVRPVSGD
jgi:poly-gamma-glutamate synthesis protein (capsule biosynthesis protein)